MGKPTGFIEFTREMPAKRSVQERLNDYNEFIDKYAADKLNQQSARCMNCGFRFAIVVVRWATLFLNLTMLYIERTGKMHTTFLHLPITFPSLPAAFARHRVKVHACLVLTNLLLLLKK